MRSQVTGIINSIYIRGAIVNLTKLNFYEQQRRNNRQMTLMKFLLPISLSFLDWVVALIIHYMIVLLDLIFNGSISNNFWLTWLVIFILHSYSSIIAFKRLQTNVGQVFSWQTVSDKTVNDIVNELRIAFGIQQSLSVVYEKPNNYDNSFLVVNDSQLIIVINPAYMNLLSRAELASVLAYLLSAYQSASYSVAIQAKLFIRCGLGLLKLDDDVDDALILYNLLIVVGLCPLFLQSKIINQINCYQNDNNAVNVIRNKQALITAIDKTKRLGSNQDRDINHFCFVQDTTIFGIQTSINNRIKHLEELNLLTV